MAVVVVQRLLAEAADARTRVSRAAGGGSWATLWQFELRAAGGGSLSGSHYVAVEV